MNTDTTLSREELHADDICQIKKSFWDERHVPELGDIVEIQDGNIIRSYMYSEVESNECSSKGKGKRLEWLFNDEVRVLKVDENENEGIKKEKEKEKEKEEKKVIQHDSDIFESNDSNEEKEEEKKVDDLSASHDLNDSNDILQALQSIVNDASVDKKVRLTKSTVSLIDTLQRFIDERMKKNKNEDLSASEKPVKSECFAQNEQNIQENQNRKTKDPKAKAKTKPDQDALQSKIEDRPNGSKDEIEINSGVKNQVSKENKKKSEYNKFMSSCLLKIKDERKDILPSQRMACAVEEWQKYKASGGKLS